MEGGGKRAVRGVLEGAVVVVGIEGGWGGGVRGGGGGGGGRCK